MLIQLELNKCYNIISSLQKDNSSLIILTYTHHSVTCYQDFTSATEDKSGALARFTRCLLWTSSKALAPSLLLPQFSFFIFPIGLRFFIHDLPALCQLQILVLNYSFCLEKRKHCCDLEVHGRGERHSIVQVCPRTIKAWAEKC